MARDPRPDRPSLDPEFVANQAFSSSFRGFDTTEVRAYLEVIADLLRDGEAREEELTQKLAAAEERLANPPPLDAQQVTALLGEETTRVIETARQAAIDIRSKSEENAARLVREAIDEATKVRATAEEHATQVIGELERETTAERAAADEYATRIRGGADDEIAAQKAEAEEYSLRIKAEADDILAVRTEEAELAAAPIRAEADRVRAEAAVEIVTQRSAADAEIAALRAEAQAEADAAREAARQEGRGMVAEARAVRERMLNDLVERRRLGRAQLDQLRGTRQWMLEVLESARSRIDQAAGDLAAPLAHDHDPIEDRSPQDAEDDALLEAMMREEPAPEPEQDSSSEAEPGPDAEASVPAVVAEVIVEAAPEPEPKPKPGPSSASASGPASAPASDEAGTGDGGETPDEADTANIDALFAKIRAARTDDPRPADEVVVDLTEDKAPAADAASNPAVESASVADPAPAAKPRAASGRTSRTAAAEPMPRVETPGQVASLLERRDAATDAIERQLARRLKRVLSDEQNELLDEVRRAGGVPTADATLPELANHAGRYAEAAGADLAGAAAAGASFYGAAPSTVTTQVDDIAGRLADELVRQLRGRLTRCFSDAEGDEAELGERIRACYREWKTQRIADTSRHFVLAAFTRGMFDAAPRASVFRWIVDDGGTPCPDAEDNALQGHVAKGDPFPTGDIYPPAHPGCRCLIVPVEAAVISRS